MERNKITYDDVGISTGKDKSKMDGLAKILETEDACVLNKGVGDFASVYDFNKRAGELGISDPLLVSKMEEPGSKQKLARIYGYDHTISHDVINHLVNDILAMGALPLSVLDVIIYGSENKETINKLISEFAYACKNNGCSLVGGETSIQPKVIDDDIYILAAALNGIVDRKRIIDGSKIQEGDVVLAVASNGLHTNGYTLVRKLLELYEETKTDKIKGESFISHIMRPHASYYKPLRKYLEAEHNEFIHGLAHITGGGIRGNLSRIIPSGLSALVDLSKVKAHPIFSYIKEKSGNTDEEMLKTFNCGVGFNIVTPEKRAQEVEEHIGQYYDCYKIGEIVPRNKNAGDSLADKVIYENEIKWPAL